MPLRLCPRWATKESKLGYMLDMLTDHIGTTGTAGRTPYAPTPAWVVHVRSGKGSAGGRDAHADRGRDASLKAGCTGFRAA